MLPLWVISFNILVLIMPYMQRCDGIDSWHGNCYLQRLEYL